MKETISHDTLYLDHTPRSQLEGFGITTIPAVLATPNEQMVIAHLAGLRLEEVHPFALILEGAVRRTARPWPFMTNLPATVEYYTWQIRKALYKTSVVVFGVGYVYLAGPWKAVVLSPCLVGLYYAFEMAAASHAMRLYVASMPVKVREAIEWYWWSGRG